jgi:uracil-DNA glycosylase
MSQLSLDVESDMLPWRRSDYASPQQCWNQIMVVGEAPGAEEVKQNQPFVGRSGQLLDKVLAEAGIIRAACFVANVFRLQPPAICSSHRAVSHSIQVKILRKRGGRSAENIARRNLCQN